MGGCSLKLILCRWVGAPYFCTVLLQFLVTFWLLRCCVVLFQLCCIGVPRIVAIG